MSRNRELRRKAIRNSIKKTSKQDFPKYKKIGYKWKQIKINKEV